MLMNLKNNSYILFCDNLCPKHGIPSIANDSIHLTFTSPPYWNYVDYPGDTGVGKEDVYIHYIDSLFRIFVAIYEKTVPGGKFVVNVSNMCSRAEVDGPVSFIRPIAHDVAQMAQDIGFIFKDEIVWHKGGGNLGSLGTMLFGSYPYPPTPRILSSVVEYIYVFAKPGKRPKVDAEIKEASKLTKEEWLEYTFGIWKVSPGRDKYHPATFPFEIAQRVVRLYSFKGDRVLDPFAGSGTTVIAAEKFDRKGIGYEISDTYAEAIHHKAEEHLPRQEQLPLEGVE